ncbi:hypothetical protein AVEN_217656-1 [Araneus ventricosus]|uniref:Uncharacterized protein n=1 Tax=Araneus ventricosus TaxID=182803 RepID=A0A4Y2HK22_ARAVE|nr:hypothetical protein AVEN_217656-1 [Araneus ventricosus]
MGIKTDPLSAGKHTKLPNEPQQVADGYSHFNGVTKPWFRQPGAKINSEYYITRICSTTCRIRSPRNFIMDVSGIAEAMSMEPNVLMLHHVSSFPKWNILKQTDKQRVLVLRDLQNTI